MKSLLPGLLLLLTLSSASADTYIRNKPVPSTEYVSRESLSRYFTPEELERVEFDPSSGQIKVDGNVIPERLGTNGDTPVVALALALGFQKRVNNDLGIVDYVATSTLSGERPNAGAPKRKGQEYNAAAARMQRALLKNRQLTTHPELERVEKIGQKLAEVSDMPGLQWNFLIVSSPSPNAFCTGVGWVAVTDGLLALNLTDDELAGVLAHEIGHGCRRDIEEQNYNAGTADKLRAEVQRKQVELNQLLTQRAEFLAQAQYFRDLARQMQHPDNIRDAQNEATKASQEASNLDRPIRNLEREIQQKSATMSDHKDFATASEFQHQDEIDADKKGLRYATTAGYSADGLMSALTKLADRNAETFGQAAYQGGQSHPSLSTRINTMRKVLAGWRGR